MESVTPAVTMLLDLGHGDQHVRFGVGGAQVERRKQVSAVRDREAGVRLASFVGHVSVDQLYPAGRLQKQVRIPAGLQHEFLERGRPRPGALHHADAPRPGLVQKMDDASHRPRMGPARTALWQVAQARRFAARHVDLDGDGLALHQPSHAAQLVEHLSGSRQEPGSVALTPGDGHRSRRNGGPHPRRMHHGHAGGAQSHHELSAIDAHVMPSHTRLRIPMPGMIEACPLANGIPPRYTPRRVPAPAAPAERRPSIGGFPGIAGASRWSATRPVRRLRS